MTVFSSGSRLMPDNIFFPMRPQSVMIADFFIYNNQPTNEQS
jgi:hypothetical protein